MLAIRNNGIADKVVGNLNGNKPKTYFVIAGALHLAGPDSTIKLLEAQGYNYRRSSKQLLVITR